MRSLNKGYKQFISIFLIALLIFSSIQFPVSASVVDSIEDANETNVVTETSEDEEEISGSDQQTTKEELKEENLPKSAVEESDNKQSNKDQQRDSDGAEKVEKKDNNNKAAEKSEESEATEEEIAETNDTSDDTTYQSSEVKERVEQSVEQTITYYKNNLPSYTKTKGSYSDYWKFSALWGAGVKDLRNDLPWESEEESPWGENSFWTNGLNKANSASNADAGTIIGSILFDKNPYSFGNQNVVEDLVNKQNDDGSFAGAWGDPWAMIALYLVDADYDEDKLLSVMVNRQTDAGMFGDADATGWTLMALAPYKDSHQDVSEAIDKSVQYIHSYYHENHELPGQNWGVNSNAIASMIMGLAAVGENLFSDKWTFYTEDAGYVNLVEDFVTSYQLDDGSFKWQQQQNNTNGAATEQSLLALANALAGESTFVRLKREKTIPEGPDVTKTNVTVRVEGIKDTILPKTEIQVETINESPTALDATIIALTKEDIPFDETYGAIYSIAGEDQAVFGGWDGWNYSVNGSYPYDMANQYEIKDGDEIIWYYGSNRDLYRSFEEANDVEKLTLIPEIDAPSEVNENEEIEVKVTATYNIFDENYNLEEENAQADIKNATIHFNGKTYSTDVNGVAVIPAEDVKAGEYELRVTKDIENSYPRLLRQSKRIIVNESEEPQEEINTIKQAIIISEEDGEIPLPLTDIEVLEGDNAIDVLKRASEQHNIPVEIKDLGWGEYVSSIAGVAELDRGEQSGWFVRINGKFADVGASDVYLIPGDEVEWLYSLDWGQDIGATEFVTIRETKPEIIIETKPEKRLVRESLQEFKIEAKTYFGTKFDPIVKLNGEVVEKQPAISTNSVQMISIFSLPTLMSVAEEQEYVYLLEFVEGRNLIEVIAVDFGGREEILEIDFVYVPEDQELKEEDPTITIEDELENVKVESPSFTFSMIAEDYLFNLLTPTIKINGETVEYEYEHFVYTVQLSEGENKVRITVEDEDGRTAEESFVVIYEKEEEKADYSDKVIEAITDVSNDIISNGVKTDWQAIGISKSGKLEQQELKQQYTSILEDKIKLEVTDRVGTGRLLITEVERLALTALALGIDPRDFNGIDLIEKIYNSEERNNGTDSLVAQGNNGIAFALITLDAYDGFEIPDDAKWTREKLLTELLGNQREDGAWNLVATASESEEANYDITGMVLTALAPYNNNNYPEVQNAVLKAVNFLSDNQLESGGFASSNENGSSIETTAQIIIGLSSNGIAPVSDEFTKEDGNLLDHLFSLQADDGGFKHTLSSSSSDLIATEQALLALVAYNLLLNNEGRLFDFKGTQLTTHKKDDPNGKVEEKEDNKQKETPEGEGSVKDEQEEPLVQGKVQDDSDLSKEETSSTADEAAKQLPKTATNAYNLLLLGTLIVLLGFSIYFIRKKLVHNKGS